MTREQRCRRGGPYPVRAFTFRASSSFVALLAVCVVAALGAAISAATLPPCHAGLNACATATSQATQGSVQQQPGSGRAGQRLIDAAKARDRVALRALLSEGTDANTRAVDGATALHWAVHRDDLDAVDLLLQAGANVEATNRYGVAPLALASLNGAAAMIEILLDAGANPNTTQPGGETALMTAARTGVVAAVRVLLGRGADPNASEAAKGQTALMWAAAENNADVVHALAEAGADVHARSNTTLDLTPNEPGDKGFTALLFAARAGQIDAARTLLEAGGNVDDTLVDGTSALVLAVMSAHYDMGVFLLERGANPDAAQQGWTALHQLAWTRRPSRGPTTVGPVARGAIDSLTLARALLASGADVNAPITKEAVEIYVGRNQMNRLGATPFFMAAHREDVEYMRLLAATGADPFRPNADGTTPLMAAAGVGLWFPGESPGTPAEAAEAVAFCLELGGDATTVDVNGDTALHGAAYWDSPRAVELLVAAGARLDATNETGWTPLRIADGVAITASIHASPATAALLRRLMTERGLPVPEPTLGVAK